MHAVKGFYNIMLKLTAVTPIIVTTAWLEEDTETHRNKQDTTMGHHCGYILSCLNMDEPIILYRACAKPPNGARA